MTRLFDTERMRDDPEYWDSLAARIARSAVAKGGPKQSGLATFVGSWNGLVAATLLVGITVGITVVLRLDPAVEGVETATEWREALQPSDNIGRVISAAANPPSIGALLLAADGTGGGRTP